MNSEGTQSYIFEKLIILETQTLYSRLKGDVRELDFTIRIADQVKVHRKDAGGRQREQSNDSE